MQVSDFPILVEALTNVSGNRLSRFPARRVENLEKALTLLDQGVEQGEIANVDFQFAKGAVNAALEDAWRGRNDYDVTSSYRRREARNIMPMKTGDFFDAFSYPQAHTTAGAIKRLEKVPADPAVDLLMPLLREVLPMCEAVQALKDKVVKRKPKTEAERNAERFTPPPATTKAMARVQDLLETLAKDAYVRLAAQLTQRNHADLEGFLAAQKAAGADPSLMGVDRFNRPNTTYSLSYHFKDSPWAAMLLRKLVRYDSRNRIVFGSDVRSRLTTLAEEEAERVRACFVVKNLKKIASILEAKGDDLFDNARQIGYEISLSGLTGDFEFSFKDGSSFEVTNSVVFVVNSHGTAFYRFPLNFRNVKLAGGKPMKAPSEKKMNGEFVGK